jgi:hypothetical protein
MGRFGPVTYKFYAPGNLSTPLNVGGVTTKTPVDGAASEFYSAEGRGSVTFVNDTALNTLAAVGNIAYATYTDAVRDDLPSGMVFAEPFVIRSRRTIPGTDLIVIEGPDLLTDLKRFTIYRPLGLETVVNTTLTAAVRAPFNTTLLYGAPRNNKSMSPTASDVEDAGREVRVTLDNGNTFVSTILERLYWNSRWYYDLRDRYPSNAAAGNAVQVRDRRIQVAQSASFAEGVEVHLTTTNGTFITLVDEAPDGDIVTLRDGIPYSAVNGAAVTSKDYSQKATNDVTQVMGYAAGWSTEFETGNGTAAGTRYGGGGDTVYDILRTISDETGEYFRIKSAEASPAGPKRTVRWNRSYVGAGVGVAGIVRLVEPAQGAMATDSAAKNRAILLSRPEHEGQYDPVTQVIPVPSDPRITLFGCSATALAAATAAGFSVVTTGLGLYAPPYVVNNSLQASLGTSQRRVTFSEVTVEGDNAVSLTEAADKMLKLSIDYLKSHVTTAKSIRVSCVSPIGIRPGDLVELYYVPPTGEYTLDYTGGNALVVMEVTRRVSNNGELAGVVITDLVLSPSPQPHATGGQEIGRRLKAVERAMVQIGTPRPAMTAVSVGTGGGTGGGTPPPAGTYLPLTGGTMTGNIGMGAGLTVDGVDVSAHAADPAAHHAPVTVTAPVSLTGQLVGLNLHSDAGLAVVSNTLRVNLDPANSGLTLGSNTLKLGTPTSVSQTSTNSVAGNGHSHAVTWTDEAVVNYNQLIGVGAAGQLSVRKLAVGDAKASLSNTTLKTLNQAATDVGLKVQAHSSQSANLVEFSSYGGSPYLKVTAVGNIESGAVGFVSGLTGWQIAKNGDAEFNNITARGEFHASVFVADEMHATGGTLALHTATKVVAPVGANDNKLPATTNSTFTLNVQAAEVDPGLNYFAVNDVIRCKFLRVNIGGAVIGLRNIFLQVTNAGTLTERNIPAGQYGYYALTVRWLGGGEATTVIPTGTAVVKWARANDAGFTGGMRLTADLPNSPYIDIYTIDATRTQAQWIAASPSDSTFLTPRVRVGNLAGVLGLSTQWGIAAGTDLSDTSTAARYFVASDQQIRLHNIDLDIYNGASQTVDLNSNGNLKLGTNVSSGATTTLEFVSSTGTLRVGPSSGPSVYWSGSNLTVRNSSNSPVITLDSSGNAQFTGVLGIGSGGELRLGTGNFIPSPPFTGVRIWEDSGIGRFATYNSGTAQVYTDTTGRLLAGGGNFQLDANGARILTASAFSSSSQEIRFVNASGYNVASIDAKYSASTPEYAHLKLSLNEAWVSTTERATLEMQTYRYAGNTEKRLLLQNGSTYVRLNDSIAYGTNIRLGGGDVWVENGDLRVNDGISAGAYFAPNQGQFVSDLNGNDWNAIVLLSTLDVAHGMTSIVNTATYGTLGKAVNGGVDLSGFTEDNIGMLLRGHVTNGDTTTANTSRAAVMVVAAKKSGTGVGDMAAGDNLFAIRNNGTTRFIVKGNGNFHYDGTGAAYDDYDDIKLLRAADLSLAGRLDRQWEQWLGYNRAAVEGAGIVTYDDDGGHMVNGARLDRLLAGTLWQLHERLARLEEQVAS